MFHFMSLLFNGVFLATLLYIPYSWTQTDQDRLIATSTLISPTITFKTTSAGEAAQILEQQAEAIARLKMQRENTAQL